MNVTIITRWGMDIDMSYEHKTTCPKCRKNGRDRNSDNLHVYGKNSDGESLGAKCFSCDYYIMSDEYRREYGFEEVELEEFEYMTTEWNEEVHNALKENTGTDGKGYRGIRTDISRSLGVRFEYSQEDGSVDKVFYPITKDCMTKDIRESIVGYKIRSLPKTFLPPVGEANKECDLFMQWKFKTFNGILLVTAGEGDALASYQMLYDNHVKSGNSKRYDEIAVVSGITGEGGLASQLRLQYEFLKSFKKIVICMDNDAAGKAATEKVAQVIPRGKAFVMNLRLNDAHEYLEKGMEREFITDFWAAKPHTIDGVKSSFDGFLEIEEEIMRPRIELPPYMRKLQHNMGGGFYQGATHNIIAATGVSKTTHMRQMVYHMIMNTDLKPTIISLEETAAKYNLELLQLHSKKNFIFGKSGEEILEYINTPHMLKLREELIQDEKGEPRYYIIDERSGDIKSIEEQIELLHTKYQSNVFVIDVLSDMLRGSSADLAEDHMAFQRRMNKEGVTIFNTMHTRKPSVGKDGKESKVTEYDALGTGSFVQSAHTNIVLNRDKMSDDLLVSNTTEVDMPKCRGGITGSAGGWYWDFGTLQCFDVDDYKRDNPHMISVEE